jgi:hypothetical protein
LATLPPLILSAPTDPVLWALGVVLTVMLLVM